MALRVPSASRAEPSLGDLARLWSEGLAVTHDPGCGCGGLFIPSLNAGMIEEDFLDYLFTKYEREKSDELMALVDARRKDASRANVSNGFDHWIMGLGEAKLSAKMRAKVVADIRTFVESLSGRRGPGVCY